MSKPNNPFIEHITELLRNRILSGTYSAGYKLSENMLSAEFGCSRTPVREAIKSLELDNMVEILPHSGTYVKNLSDEENREITEIRGYLEALAFRLAIEKNAETSELHVLCRKMEKILSEEKIDFVEYGKIHYQFHLTLIKISDNNMLIDIYERLNLNTAKKLIYNQMNADEIRKTITEHIRIVDLLDAKDYVKGTDFVIQHLWDKRDRLLS